MENYKLKILKKNLLPEELLKYKYSRLGIDFPRSISDIKPGESFAIFHIFKEDWTENNIYYGIQNGLHAFINVKNQEVTLYTSDTLEQRISIECIAFTAPSNTN